jgi:hypothetical protein
MQLNLLEGTYTVAKCTALPSLSQQQFLSVTVTENEISLVGLESVLAEYTDKKSGFRALKIEGQLNFELVGIIAKISSILAEAEISIFVISTYNTDYILVKEDALKKATETLIAKGYTIVNG